ncbi:MAG: response regulator [Clostridiales bacterium]|nr:response regulator [Clostridiales bacterium]
MLKLIIVDDESIIRDGLVNYIDWKKLNLQIAGSAPNGEAALELFTRAPADIVLTDVKMPHMDGLQLIENIKAIAPSTVIILLSVYSDFKYAQKALKLGAFDYILKPVDVKVLESTFTNAVNYKLKEMKNESNRIPFIEGSDFDHFNSKNYPIKLQEDLIKALKAGNESGVMAVLNRMWKLFDQKQYPLNLIKRISFTILDSTIHFIIEINENPSVLFEGQDPWVEISQMNSGAEVYGWMREVFCRICDFVRSGKKHKNNTLVKETIKIVENDYIDSSFCLNAVSDKLYVTSNYLSSVFKCGTGLGFQEYLTNYRIEKSKQLLRNMKYKIYDVSYAVGYADPHYFSRIFKESTGMTPKEYREKFI